MGHYAARVLGQALPRLGAAAWGHVKEMQRKSEALLRVDERWRGLAEPGRSFALHGIGTARQSHGIALSGFGIDSVARLGHALNRDG